MADGDDNPDLNARSLFKTTCWTEILQAGDASQDSEKAFAALYRDYWPPLYGYVRRRGLSHEEAEEITQDFFVTLLEKARLAGLRRDGGRFRSFLLTSMKNFLINDWKRRSASKRGGGALALSLDETAVQERITAKSDSSEELSFDREWAHLVMNRALTAIEQEFRAGHKEKTFAVLFPLLQGDGGGRPYGEIATELGTTESAIKVSVHRMRQRYGQILRDEIARTVDSRAEVQEELRHLLRVISS